MMMVQAINGATVTIINSFNFIKIRHPTRGVTLQFYLFKNYLLLNS